MNDFPQLGVALLLVLTVAGLGWLAMVWPLRVCPRPSSRFALGTGLLLMGVAWSLARGTNPQGWVWPLPNLVCLYAFVAFHHGARELFRQPPWTRAELLLLALVTVGFVGVPPHADSLPVYRMLFSATGLVLGGLMARAMWGWAREAFNPGVASALVAPLVGFAGVMLWRLLDSLRHGLQPSAEVWVDRALLGYFFLVFALLVHVSLFACVLMHLVLIIRRHAEHDVLTGLANRRHFQQRLGQERARSQRNGRGFALALLDLDHFKHINDQHGHDAGDAALRHAAQVLTRLLRKGDLLGRWGGEEFIVLMPDTNLAQAQMAADRMREALADQPLVFEHQHINVLASIGVACSDIGDNHDLIRNADAALYVAKKRGRNCVVTSEDLVVPAPTGAT